MRKLLCVSLWFNIVVTIVSLALGVTAVFVKALQESLAFLVFISIFAITSTHLLGTLTTIVSIKELKELKTKT